MLTLRFCFSGQKPQEIWAAVKEHAGMSAGRAVAASAFFYLFMEGIDHEGILLGQQAEKQGS